MVKRTATKLVVAALLLGAVVVLLFPQAIHNPQPTRIELLPGVLKEPFTNDLPAMRERGVIRVLVTYNRTNFFLAGPVSKGFEYELLKQYEGFLNEGLGSGELHTELVFIPMPLGELLPALNAGVGDIAAAGLTITPERGALVGFTDPYIDDVHEVVVGRAGGPELESLDQLAGKRLFVVAGSSYADHLRQLNRRFAERGLEPIAIGEVVESMQSEDLLEMVGRGVIDYTVVDEHIAHLWSQAIPELQIHAGLVVNQGGQIAWAVRKNNPELLESLNGFIADHRKGSLIGNVLFERYFESDAWTTDPLDPGQRELLKKMAGLIQRYAEQYGFDWLLIAAQAYQESGFDQGKVSPAGAMGVMQLRKSTAADRNVAIKQIGKLENNIHAGVKYLAFLRDRYFADEAMSDETRGYFALAAYNAGPAKVRQMRERAAEMGLDPDRWLGNTELAALEIVGQETVRYVRNIIKYYSSYRMTLDQRLEVREAVEQSKEGAVAPARDASKEGLIEPEG